MSIASFFRPLIVALLLFEGGLQAQPLVEMYKSQEDLRRSIAKICQSQFEKALYLPVGGQAKDLRYMISAKGVQAIKSVVVPARSGGSYKCDRGGYEHPMLLRRTYSLPHKEPSSGRVPLRRFPSDPCLKLIASGVVHPSDCEVVRKVRFELEPCTITQEEDPLDALLAGQKGQPVMRITLETSCLVEYEQFDDGLVKRRERAFRRSSRTE